MTTTPRKGDEPLNNPAPMHASPRCGARTRAGPPCRAPAVAGKARCRMHGGARGSGGPKGRRNGRFRHGNRCGELRDVVRELREWAKLARAAAEKVGR